MSGAVIINTLLRCIRLAALAAAVFSALFGAGYVVYRRRLHGEKPFPRRLWLVLALLVGWAAVVLGLTLFYRISGEAAISRAGYTGFNVRLLRCYVNAWNERSLVGLQLIVFNILMFVPLGALLPFLPLGQEKGVGARAACFVSLLATCSVETLQLVTGRGCFDVDDMLHNWLGAMLGYAAAVFLADLVRNRQPNKRLFWRIPAVLLLMAAAALSGLAAWGLQSRSALPSVPPQKLRQAALEGKPLSRLAIAGTSAPEQPAVPVFASLFGGRRAAATAYCDALPDALEASVIQGEARLRFGETELSVPEVLQLPQLPNGCEATSLAALLQYRGFEANKLDLAYGYIPREDFTESRYGTIGPDPEHAYAGDPASDSGFYCFAAPLAQGANSYLHEMGSSMHAFNVTGVTDKGLEQYIRGGDPVVVWITLDLSEPYARGFQWIIGNTGQVYMPYSNLHCVVLMGWGRDTCTLMDPLQGICTVDRQTFLTCFEQMGRRALVIH